MDQTRKNNNVLSDSSVVRQTSMGTLIMWNISKAVKTNPLLDIQAAIRTSYERLMNKASDNRNTENPEDQYLMCSILAWQRLGHNGCDSLYQFIETKLKEERQVTEKNKEEERIQAFEKRKRLCPGSFISYNGSSYSDDRNLPYYDAVGPVVKLPVETKIVMHVDKCDTCALKSKKKPDKVLMEKIDAACCMESACLERLTKLDKETSELRTRAQHLARREAQRMELLQRAEASWKDLEMGYQRRLAAAEEKEEDINKHIQKLIQERNDFKNACTSLAQELKEKGDAAEKKQALLATLDKEVCNSACERLHLSEEAARLDAELAELQCKSTQLDRELQFKEEQVRGRLQNMENEFDCARALTYEAERTIHAELSALRDQLAKVSEQLLEEDEINGLIKEELEQLRQEKMELVEDLEGCQDLCSRGTQKKVDDLNKMREQLKELKDKVMECQCKLPVDEAVEVKRTPSLVALCKCLPNEKFSESCSCTSLRTTLLTNLLSDLFSGLQSELGCCCSQMPCQLLKCLEDNHNWENSSVIKNNLQSYFSKLLIGELNIAIATSIEKYHARWVGASCADAVRRQTTTCCPADTNTSPDRVSSQVEKRAQKLAAKLAEKLFQERADELTAKAKEVLKTGPPPCDCSGRTAAVYPCFVKQPNIGSARSTAATACDGGVGTSAHWRRTHQNVSQLKAQLEDLKKDSIKKEDLKMMEENIVKIVQRSITETTTDDYATMNQLVNQNTKTTKKAKSSVPRSTNTDQFIKRSPTKLNSIKKKQLDISHPKQAKKNILLGLHMSKPDKPSKQVCPTYAVNLCLCGVQREDTKKKQNLDEFQYHDSKKPHQGLVINDIFPKSPNVKQTKPIVKHIHSEDINSKKKNSTDSPYCRSDVACFHKPPSNTSIDNLFGTLARWKCDLFKLNKSNKYKICDDGINEKPINENKNKVIDENKIIDEKVTRDVSLETTSKVSEKTSINKSELHFVKEDVKVSVGTELQNDLPVVNTDSEYMGAINLEKSNENFCKCVIDTENLSKSPYSCLNSAACNCYLGSKNEQEVKDRTKSKYTPENAKLVSEFKQPNMPQKENKDENNFEKQQTDMASPKENIYDHDMSNISKTSPLFAANSEYCITFLGVTLKNNNPGKDFIGKDKACYNIHQTTHKRDKKNKKQAEKPYDLSSKKEPKITDQCNGDDLKLQNHLDPSDRNNKLNELKSLINNLMSNQQENVHKNEDKALDTSSLKKSEKTSCVCCNANKIDDSSDLEVNAFHLLKEHLRNKLDEFKITTCKSNCISPSEEETLFSSILQRVRQVISENTLNVACKCVNEEPSEGSWNRAYTLLQEYLKIKMKRVQCLCQSPENTESAVLPDVLEKVCNLIDDDFKRLKSLCKCKLIRYQTDKNLDYSVQNEFPEKDTNVDNHINNSSYVKGTSIVSILPLKTTVSHVSSDQKVNTSPYSTDYKKNVDTTTSHHSGNSLKKCVCLNQTCLKKSLTEFGTQMVTNYCINVAEQTMSTAEFKKTTDSITDLNKTVFLGKTNENSKYDANRITNFPYIGYTIDCSCNGILGECSCYKSLSKNTDNINSIWTAVTSNKSNVKKHSYIMNAVPDKANRITELTVKSKTGLEKSRKKVFCDATISALDNEDITLKFSKDKLRKSRIPSTTTTYITSKDDASLEAEEPIDWCDCSRTKTKSHKAHDVSDGTWSGSLYYPINNLMNRKKTEAKEKSDPIHFSRSLPSNCECSLVPMCHVKMLVENIEKRLFQSKCTCDSLCPTVCPEHSDKNVEK